MSLFVGAGMAVVWGLAHIAPTRSVVAGFGPLSPDNRRVLIMEWVAEGLTLAFLGTLALLLAVVAPAGDAVARLAHRAVAAMLIVMAGWSLATGARTSILPMKLCPAIKTAAAVMILAGTM